MLARQRGTAPHLASLRRTKDDDEREARKPDVARAGSEIPSHREPDGTRVERRYSLQAAVECAAVGPAHSVIDYGFGLSAITAPFIFGYYKTAPMVAAVHIATGIGTILTSLITDYRADKGVGRSDAATANSAA